LLDRPHLGVTALANAIPDMGAMTKFDISSNYIRGEGGKALAAGLKGNQVIMELNISGNRLGKNEGYNDDISGVIAIANAIPDMGALTSLNLSSNYLKPEGAKIVANAIKVTNCDAVVLVPFSCPSGHCLNYCCLLLSTG
jgi:Ran GTPase-activating protein (RanGAP) involved in mRNA processing and transport